QNLDQRSSNGDVWRCHCGPRQGSVGRNHKSWVSDQSSCWPRRSGSARRSSTTPAAEALIARLKSCQFSGKGANCFRPVTDPVLHFRRQLCKSLFESIRNEDRIVTESTRAARKIDNRSFDNSFEFAE